MNFKFYQERSRATAVYPTPVLLDDDGTIYSEMGFVYPAMGLAGEAGEVLEKCKKIIRDDSGYATQEKRTEIEKELGDVLWYVAQLCSEFKLDMGECAEKNLAKLQSRKERGVLTGSGDNR